MKNSNKQKKDPKLNYLPINCAGPVKHNNVAYNVQFPDNKNAYEPKPSLVFISPKELPTMIKTPRTIVHSVCIVKILHNF